MRELQYSMLLFDPFALTLRRRMESSMPDALSRARLRMHRGRRPGDDIQECLKIGASQASQRQRIAVLLKLPCGLAMVLWRNNVPHPAL
jgi:hypothetical protein